jgi:hypothetical protein
MSLGCDRPIAASFFFYPRSASSDTADKPGWRRTTPRRTKFGCGIGACDARTVQLNGKAERSCITAIGDIGDQEITTFKA